MKVSEKTCSQNEAELEEKKKRKRKEKKGSPVFNQLVASCVQ